MRIGYILPKTATDKALEQRSSLLKANCPQIISERTVATDIKHRPQLNNLIKTLKAKDTIVISHWHAINKSSLSGLVLIGQIFKQNAQLEVLDPPLLFTPQNTQLKALTEFALSEYNLNLKRARKGRKEVKDLGLPCGGRQKALSKAQIDQVRKMRQEGQSLTQIAQTIGSSIPTVHRALSLNYDA